MPSTQHLVPYCLIINEHTVDVTRPFQLKRGLVPTHLVFHMPDVPNHFFQLTTLTRWYTQRLDDLQHYAQATQQRFSNTHLTVDVMCGSRQQVLQKLRKHYPPCALPGRPYCAENTRARVL